MLFVAIWAVSFQLLLSFTAFLNVLRKPFLRRSVAAPENFPRISVLIPARNEALRISETLDSLLSLNDLPFEIIVLNDNSEDETPQILNIYQKKNSIIKVISGKSLPENWLGKNFACAQLAAEARGDFLLFIDADVHLSGNILPDLYETLSRSNADFLSIFPRQKLITEGEKLAVPMMLYILLSLLPFALVRRKNHGSLSAANGQLMFFRQNVYQKYAPHEKVKSCVTEDIEIAKYLKKNGLTVDVLLGDERCECRMYASLKEATDGFSKNFFAGFSYNVFFLLFFLSSIGIVPLLSAVFVPETLLTLCVFIFIHAIFLAKLSQASFCLYFCRHIPRVFLFHYLAILSVFRYFKKKNQWKGRAI